MEVGIGLPTTIKDVTGPGMLDWARRAEREGFSCLATLDRIVYANYEPLVALAAAAAVTERIGLTTAILIVPYRESAAIVAKQAATIQHLSGGRLELGVAIGSREDDYEPFGVEMRGRGKRLDAMLEEITRLWAGEERGFAGGVGPDVSGDPPTLLVGGASDASYRRAARFGDGWIMGGAPAEEFRVRGEKLEAAWREAGREERPKRSALTYFALGDDPEGDARRSILDYYAVGGDYAQIAFEGVALGEEAVRRRVQEFEEAGADELIMFPSSSDPVQVDLLARTVLS